MALVVMATTSITACADSVVGNHAATDRASVFDDLWSNVDLHYSFLEYKQIDWAALGAHYRPLALAAKDDQEFARVIDQMLRELRDPHVALTPGGGASTLRYVARSERVVSTFDAATTVNRYVTAARTLADGRLTYGMLSPDVGYLRLASFTVSGWAGEVDRALEALPAAQRLIIDVRSNHGGVSQLAADVAGRFADRTRTFGYLRVRNGPGHGDFTDFTAETVSPTGHQFHGPVFVLTDRQVMSSAEQFVLAMRTRPSTIVVGDTTAGASGGPVVRELANGWTYRLSEWIEYTTDRRIFEGIGLPPDIAVASAAGSTSGDAVLERALALARQ
jgi:C-terminal processing protease CtpA/Prc